MKNNKFPGESSQAGGAQNAATSASGRTGAARAALWLALVCGALQAQEPSPAPDRASDAAPATIAVGGADEPVRLTPLEVTGDRAALPRYVADSASSATKTDTPLIETPQSISVLTEERLRDLGALTLQDALRYSAGVRSDAYGVDARGDFAIVRGTEYVPYRDGLRSVFGHNNNVRPDVYALESVEVLRGPSSVLYGQGSSGGMVNVVSKRPQARAAQELRLEYGEYDRRQLSVDSTGPLSGNESLLYRIVGLARSAGTQVDFVDDNRWYVAPSLTWTPARWLRWTVLGNVQRDESGSSTAFLPWEGTIRPSRNGQIPTNRFTSEPAFDAYDTWQDAVTSVLALDFGEHWTLQQSLRYSDSGAHYRSLFPNVYTGDPYLLDPLRRRSVLRVGFASDTQAQALTADQRLRARWRWGSVEQTLLAGFDATRTTLLEQQGLSSVAQILLQGSFDLYEPRYGNFIAPTLAPLPDLALRQNGMYVQDQLRIGDGLVALLGVRRDEARSQNAGESEVRDAQTSRRAGLLYRFAAGVAPYLSYSESFDPVAGYDQDGAPFRPVRGVQREAGLKFESADNTRMLTVAAFDLRERNRLAPGDTPAQQKQLGTSRIRGVEVEAMAALLDTLDVIASYTHLQGQSDQGPNADNGARYKNLVGVARDSVSAWLHWRLGYGFSVGAGARYTAAIPDESATVEVPAVTLFDAALAWESPHWRLAVNASNLEDQTVIAVCLERGDCFYGPRRNVVGSLSYRF